VLISIKKKLSTGHAVDSKFGMTFTHIPIADHFQRQDYHNDSQADVAYEVINAMWRACCATVITVIWRQQVDSVHAQQLQAISRETASAELSTQLTNTYRQLTWSHLPLTPATVHKYLVASTADRQLCEWGVAWSQHDLTAPTSLVGFFDGGSRGNPGARGAGSVLVSHSASNQEDRIIWACSLSLASTRTTNNQAEFIGLYQLLRYAASAKIHGIHVVGDSAMILNSMRTRRPPRATKLRHWYRLARRLADACGVMTWNHHYRANNKMADLLTNLTMDTHTSRQDMTKDTGSIEPRYPGLQEFINNDMAHWLLTRHSNGL
jgi:ribonuclease HI